MTEPTTEELVDRLKDQAKDDRASGDIQMTWVRQDPRAIETARFLYARADGLTLVAQRLSDLERERDDLEGKLGEARKAIEAIRDLSEEALTDWPDNDWTVRRYLMNQLSALKALASEALKLTASGGEGSSSASSERAARRPSDVCDQQRSDLLEAMRTILDGLVASRGDIMVDDWIEVAEAAISKAESK